MKEENGIRIQKLRNRMYAKIKGTNKYIDESYLNGLTTKNVIGLIHPLDRDVYQNEYDLLTNN